MHCLFEQADGSFKSILRPDLMEDPVIEWAYRSYVNRLHGLTNKLEGLQLPIDRGNARYPNI